MQSAQILAPRLSCFSFCSAKESATEDRHKSWKIRWHKFKLVTLIHIHPHPDLQVNCISTPHPPYTQHRQYAQVCNTMMPIIQSQQRACARAVHAQNIERQRSFARLVQGGRSSGQSITGSWLTSAYDQGYPTTSPYGADLLPVEACADSLRWPQVDATARYSAVQSPTQFASYRTHRKPSQGESTRNQFYSSVGQPLCKLPPPSATPPSSSLSTSPHNLHHNTNMLPPRPGPTQLQQPLPHASTHRGAII